MRALAFVIALPAIASAFSDQSQYSEPVNVGGAAGRYFTGSRVDGYACSVCHQGATTNDFTIDPLPERLEPGRRYDVVIRWRDPETPHSLHIELVTKGGAHPAVAVPMTISRESRCGQIDTGPSAIYTIDVGVRRVVGVEPCGASLVSLSFLASADPIELAVSGVRSDNSETPIGDATFERRITFNAAADSGGCSTSGGAGLLVALALLTIRSRRAR